MIPVLQKPCPATYGKHPGDFCKTLARQKQSYAKTVCRTLKVGPTKCPADFARARLLQHFCAPGWLGMAWLGFWSCENRRGDLIASAQQKNTGATRGRLQLSHSARKCLHAHESGPRAVFTGCFCTQPQWKVQARPGGHIAPGKFYTHKNPGPARFVLQNHS